MNNANARQVGGSHYQSEYQHWDFVRLCLGNRYLEGCFSKYVARHRKKNGLQDLGKALHYLDKIIELFGAEQYDSAAGMPDPLPEFRVAEFIRQNELTGHEASLIEGIAFWNSAAFLAEMREELLTLIEKEEQADRERQAMKAGAHMVGDQLVGVSVSKVIADEIGGLHQPDHKVYERPADVAGEEPGPGYVDQDGDDGRFGRGCV